MTKRIHPPQLRARKGAEKIVVLTAYTAPFARAIDPHVDVLLVGDSLGMVLYGMESTLPVSLEMMITHGRAVVNASRRGCVVVDMPFGSYQASPQQAFESSARILAQTGCQAVKLEGGREMADTIAFLTARGIPVMGHVGLMPQRVAAYGGYGARGKLQSERDAVLADAKAVAKAGAFSLVVEAVVEPLARAITEAVDVPTIGIGASVACDGQVLVSEDMLGLSGEYLPRFVKQYAQLSEMVSQAAQAYADEVRNGAFPTAEYCYKG